MIFISCILFLIYTPTSYTLAPKNKIEQSIRVVDQTKAQLITKSRNHLATLQGKAWKECLLVSTETEDLNSINQFSKRDVTVERCDDSKILTSRVWRREEIFTVISALIDASQKQYTPRNGFLERLEVLMDKKNGQIIAVRVLSPREGYIETSKKYLLRLRPENPLRNPNDSLANLQLKEQSYLLQASIMTFLFFILIPENEKVIIMVRDHKRQGERFNIQEIHKNNTRRNLLFLIMKAYILENQKVPVKFLSDVDQSIENALLHQDIEQLTQNKLSSYQWDAFQESPVDKTVSTEALIPREKVRKDFEHSQQILKKLQKEIKRASIPDIKEKDYHFLQQIIDKCTKIAQSQALICHDEESDTIYRVCFCLPEISIKEKIQGLQCIQQKLYEKNCALPISKQWYFISGVPPIIENNNTRSQAFIQEMTYQKHNLETHTTVEVQEEGYPKIGWLRDTLFRTLVIYVHLLRLGIPHGDLKTNNLLFFPTHSEWKCIDFDLTLDILEDTSHDWGIILYTDLFASIELIINTLDPNLMKTIYYFIRSYHQSLKGYKRTEFSHAIHFIDLVYEDSVLIKIILNEVRALNQEMAQVIEKIINFIKNHNAHLILKPKRLNIPQFIGEHWLTPKKVYTDCLYSA